MPGITRDPMLFGFPQVTIRGYATLADRERVRQRSNDYQANAILNLLVAGQSRGRFNFNGRGTANSTDTRRQEPSADFLAGVLNNTNRRVKPMTSYVFSTYLGAFVQDDWKITRNLKLSTSVCGTT